MFNITEPLPPITLTVKDLVALDTLLNLRPSTDEKDQNQIAEYLEREITRADVVAEKDLPPNTVRMHSLVTYVNNLVGTQRSLTLVYPKEAQYRCQ
jgi:transcription elongation GreA/GreB family factor